MHTSAGKCHRSLWIVAFFILSFPNSLLPAQCRTSQVLVLKDPTPREPDLEKRFRTTPTSNVPNTRKIANYNRQRFQLIGKASEQMHSLAQVLQASVVQPRTVTTGSQEAQIAGAIETLASNVYTALATSSPRSLAKGHESLPVAIDDRAQAAQLSSDTKQLEVLTNALQSEVSKSSADTLPVGILIRSAQVRELARSLKQRLQPE